MVLDGASLTVTVAKKDELLLLAGPQTTHTLAVHLHAEWQSEKPQQNQEISTLNCFKLLYTTTVDVLHLNTMQGNVYSTECILLGYLDNSELDEL